MLSCATDLVAHSNIITSTQPEEIPEVAEDFDLAHVVPPEEMVAEVVPSLLLVPLFRLHVQDELDFSFSPFLLLKGMGEHPEPLLRWERVGFVRH